MNGILSDRYPKRAEKPDEGLSHASHWALAIAQVVCLCFLAWLIREVRAEHGVTVANNTAQHAATQEAKAATDQLVLISAKASKIIALIEKRQANAGPER